ncbi:uncharacterized protein LOC113054992 [Carassius auratus]|uniref:Uncharacterized protein LOC113054992 n=1 Tax=Carassius auratus TaxID=7957 RepID=A0A6P6KZ79_CARAU|nr:uncharacterized protein LOC113054992 [Carassius auratus]
MNLKEKERNPTDGTLDKIAKDLLSFFNGFEHLHEVKRTIEKKCDIKKEQKHKCWPEDDIKRAWEETKKMYIKSSRRKHWARIIILQVVKSFVCDMCKRNAAQKNRRVTTNERGCETRPNPEDRSSESKAEPETVGAAGGLTETLGEGENTSKVSKRTASGTDVAPSATEVNPDNSENKNDAMVNEHRDTLVNISQQQKNVQLYLDVSDKENMRRENGLRSTCGKAQSMKGDSEDIPRQRKAEPETQGAAGGAQQISGGHHQTSSYHRQTFNDILSQTQFQATGIYPGAPYSQSWTGVTLGSQGESRLDETIYIRIPLSVIAEDEPTDSNEVSSRYRLIDGFPSNIENTDIRKRKSIRKRMSFDNSTNNAEWVYEILNKKTVDNNCKQEPFGNGYDRGHLAAAANHRWCWEAYNDTYLHSNIIPQDHSLNIGNWKSLENRCRSMAKDIVIQNVHVYTGPLYLQRDRWTLGGKEVPSHLFQVIIVENVDRTIREPMIPNEEPTGDFDGHRVDIEDIEHISRLVFLEHRPILRETDTKISLNEEDLNQTQQHADIEVCISV